MKKYAVILAGGEGKRAGGDVPKQFQMLSGRPVVWWSIKAFHDADPATSIVLVLHPGFLDDWDIIFNSLPQEERIPHIICCGGKDRSHSVANGVSMVSEDILGKSDFTPHQEIAVAIHDGARPLITSRMIAEGFDKTAIGVCSVPVVACTSSLRIVSDDGESRPVDRSIFREVQTPQNFRLSDLEIIYGRLGEGDFTDDASLAQHKGKRVVLYPGEPTNIKITNPMDFAIAESLINS